MTLQRFASSLAQAAGTQSLSFHRNKTQDLVCDLQELQDRFQTIDLQLCITYCRSCSRMFLGQKLQQCEPILQTNSKLEPSEGDDVWLCILYSIGMYWNVLVDFYKIYRMCIYNHIYIYTHIHTYIIIYNYIYRYIICYILGSSLARSFIHHFGDL